MDKQSAIALGVTAGLGVGYLLDKAQPAALHAADAKTPEPAAKDLDEVERLIRPNILALTPYRCARDDYDQGSVLNFAAVAVADSLTCAVALDEQEFCWTPMKTVWGRRCRATRSCKPWSWSATRARTNLSSRGSSLTSGRSADVTGR
ncbi:unnamed protein product [Phytophthora lilii]|uniref:Unnamed protein product n=1 Tax=Phytophthora lilii TaxID=2077276 RepID=A0A9W6WQ45_9STRA|nr:unnamed protein product [Phytophthora lilii]